MDLWLIPFTYLEKLVFLSLNERMYARRRWVISSMCIRGISRISFSRTILSSLQAPASVHSSAFRSASLPPQHQQSSEPKHSRNTTSTPTTFPSQPETSSLLSKRPTPTGGLGSIMAARLFSPRITSRRSSLRPRLLLRPCLLHTS